jgi:aminoglycoside phosphotransferase (APT) family kinase protein
LLTEGGIIQELRARELIGTAALVDGDIRVTNASRRNHNFCATTARGPSYFLKQGVDEERAATLAREAALYRAIHAQDEARPVSVYLPAFYDFDSEKAILILEQLTAFQTLRELHSVKGRFRTDVASALGRALSALHSVRQMPECSATAAGLPPPWILSFYRPDLRLLGELSSADLQVIKVVQAFPEFRKHLEELYRDWRQEALIHGDFKWDNCLAPVNFGRALGHGLKIVDWELGGIGDPAWDVGSAFSAYLSFWVFSMPVTGGAPPEQFVDLARYPLARMQPAMRGLWSAYAKGKRLNAANADRALLRSTRYCAARMVQTAFEQVQTALQLTGTAICLLQLAMNMLQRPEDTVARLIGIGGEAPLRI